MRKKNCASRWSFTRIVSVWNYHSTLLKIPEDRRFQILQAYSNCLRNSRGYNLEGKGSTIILNTEMPYPVKHCHIPEEFTILEMLIWTSCWEGRYVKGQTFNLPSLARIKGQACNSSKWEILKHTEQLILYLAVYTELWKLWHILLRYLVRISVGITRHLTFKNRASCI
jgi:hypothetical protein